MNIIGRIAEAALLALMLALACGQQSNAQAYGSEAINDYRPYDRGANVSVMDRPHPEYEPAGIRAGGFTILPRVDIGGGYSDNVLASKTDTVSDGYAILNPSVNLNSNWSRDALIFAAGLSEKAYFHQVSENETGWFIDSQSQFDLSGDASLKAGADIRKTYEDRVATDAPVNAQSPVSLVDSGGYMRGVFNLTRVRLIVSGDIDETSYANVGAIGGGLIDEHFRDQTAWRFVARGDYGLSPALAIFLQGTYGGTDVTGPQPSGQPGRSSQETRLLAGANFDVGALVRGEIGVGYLRRNYTSHFYGIIQGPAIATHFEYFPTPLVTITLTGRRSFEDSVLLNSGGYFDNFGAIRADYELFRNLIISAGGSEEYDDFGEFDRRDQVTNISLGLRYLLNRAISVQGQAEYIERSSTGGKRGPEYDVMRTTITLILRR